MIKTFRTWLPKDGRFTFKSQILDVIQQGEKKAFRFIQRNANGTDTVKMSVRRKPLMSLITFANQPPLNTL